MARTDLGDKQVCPSCGARFYDLRKRPATCPKCSTAFDPTEEGVRVKRGRSRVAAHDAAYGDDEELEAKKAKTGAEADEDEEEETVGDAADDDSVPLIEDEEEFNEDELGVPGAEEDDGNR